MTSMLPAIPTTLGNLKDVFRSAEQSVLGQTNALQLVGVESAIVIMVDGLGFNNLAANASVAPFLTGCETQVLHSGFPSTTVVSIVSFATGKTSSEHGMFGYKIYDRELSETVNLLSGVDKYSVLDYALSAPISEHAAIEVHAVTLSEYSDSGMTRATMHNAKHHFAESIAGRLSLAIELVQESGRLVYVYIPELDQAAHKFGVASSQWQLLLGELDESLSTFAKAIRSGVGALLTADHGILDVPSERHIYLDLISELENQVLDVGGDPRVPFIYLKPGAKTEVIREAVQDYCSNRAVVFTVAEAIEHNFWSVQILRLSHLLPDLIVMATSDVALYHRSFSRPTSLKMIGQHGAMSPAEIEIPLIRLGAY
jgi:predicted AlkP superfamily pyrophosphatase or phosphodiesterase